MSIKIGVTGGIGSGKSTVCKVFSVLGIPVFYADEEARNIMEHERRVVDEVNAIAGKDMYVTGSLNRQELAALIFNNKNLLDRINRLVHPVVLEAFMEWEARQSTGYVVLESAILQESGALASLDKVVFVMAPLEERIQRVMRRNNFTREQVLERIRNQGDENEKAKYADYIIHNSDHEMVVPAILKIHDELTSMIKNSN